MPDMDDDIGADIAAAIAEVKGAGAPTSSDAAPLDMVSDDGVPEGETPAEKQKRIDATGRAHDETGKFTAKPKDEPEAKPAKGAKVEAVVAEPSEAKDVKDQPKPLQPPVHWTAQAKAEFVNAPRALQEQALKREEEIEAARKEWGGKAEDYNRLDKVIAPHRDRLAREGRDPASAINQLFAFENAMMNNPVAGASEILRVFAPGNELRVIDQIARANGYQLVQANNQGQAPAQGEGGQPQPLDLDNHPTVRRLNETIQNLTKDVTARQQAAEQSSRQATLNEIEAFKSDPAHLYYENVKVKMAALLSIGDQAGDKRPIKERLQEAYDEAVYADPTTRAIMFAEKQRQADAEAARKAAAARHAAGSVTGSPGNGAAAPRPRSHSNSIEDDVREALLESRA